MKYKFKSKRVKKNYDSASDFKAPDYSNIIQLGKRYFTLKGWLESLNSDISYTLEEITEEMVLKDKYLAKELMRFKGFNPSG